MADERHKRMGPFSSLSRPTFFFFWAWAFVSCAHFFPPSRKILEPMAVDPVGDHPSSLKIDSRPSVRVAVCSVGRTLLTAGQSGPGKNC